MRVRYHFVPMGSVAPEPVPDGQLWLDVGSRAAVGVLDHHGGDTDVWSASQLVLERHEDLVPKDLLATEEVTLVLHDAPDLDAACSAWLCEMLLHHGELVATSSLSRMVQAVSEADQGILRTDDPLHCWPVVARTALSSAADDGASDEERVRRAARLLTRTLVVLQAGGTLEDAAEQVTDAVVRVTLSHAQREYAEDFERGTRFQVRLPVRLLSEQLVQVPPGPVGAPVEARWSLVDGLVLDNPSSLLFRELARGDRERSPLGQGFSLLVVVRDTPGRQQHGLRRYVISADPLTGLHLEGLGARLEAREKEVEDAKGEPAFGGRERLEPGTGRHGLDVASPWYDGRGHNFSIIDSPSIRVGGTSLVGSQLSERDVLDQVWEYGDPARFMNVRERTFHVVWPVRVTNELELDERVTKPDELWPDLSEEVRRALAGVTIRPAPSGWPGEGVAGFGIASARVLVFPERTAVWLAELTGEALGTNPRDLARSLRKLRKALTMPLPSAQTRVIEPMGAPYFVVCVQAEGKDVSFENPTGETARALYRLAAVNDVTFHERASRYELEQVARVVSLDRQVLVMATDRGMVLASRRDLSLGDEKYFNRPERLAALASLVVGQEAALHDVLTEFAAHTARGALRRNYRLILADRQRLMDLEQRVLFRRVTDHPLGELIYDMLRQIAGVDELFAEARSKVETLAEHVRDTRSEFYQRLGFWVTFLFGPLIITAGLFGGIQQSRSFADQYVSALDGGSHLSGWLHFGMIFIAMVCITGLIWWVIDRVQGSDSLARTDDDRGSG